MPPDETREHLARLLASRTFRSAAGQRAFLRYTVEETLAGRSESIKEYLIAVEAFGRDESFDPRLDPIVRTQARKLRAKLASYYEGEGAGETLRIEYPKGSYIPVFKTAIDRAAAELPGWLNRQAPPRRSPMGWSLFAASVLAAVIGTLSLRGDVSAAGRPVTVAVLPFTNLSEEPSESYLTDGITEELMNVLSHTLGTQLVSRTSAFRFKRDGVGIAETGRRLNAQTLVEGSVRRSGDRVRVTAQLVDARSGQSLWSGDYEREASALSGIVREIAGPVANLAGTHMRRSGRRYSPDPTAYQSYLKGLHHWNKLTPEGLIKAIQYFQEAIAQDPHFARAHAALADSYVMAPQVSATPPPEVISKIRAAATRALELDGSLGEAHIDLAVCAEYDFDWETAEREFKKGLQLSPGNAVAHLWYAKLLALRGRKREVLEHRRLAAELDPVSPYSVQAVGGYYSVMGEYDKAIEYFRSALELEPGFGLARQGLGIAYLMKNQHARAFAELKSAGDSMKGPRRLALLGYAYGVAGRAVEARKILASLEDTRKRSHVPALAIAHVHLGLSDWDRAFVWMERAVAEKDLSLTLQWDSLYEPLRGDPRYQRLLRQMRLIS